VLLDVGAATNLNLWSGNAARTGTSLVVSNLDYNGPIAAKSSTAFGFCAATASATDRPRVLSTAVVPYDFGTGYCASVEVKNNRTTPTTGWSVVLDIGQSKVDNLWEGVFTQTGSRVTVSATAYNAAIVPGGSVTFGFCGVTTGTSYKPAMVSATTVP